MRALLQILLLSILQAISLGQGSIKIDIRKCLENHALQEPISFAIYKDDSLLEWRDSIRSNKVLFVDLKIGDYEIYYETFPNTPQEIHFRIDSSENIDYKICHSYNKNILKSKQKTFISTIEDEENYTIHYKSIGCFHLEEDSITLSHVGDNYFISNKSKVKKLTDKDLVEIDRLENELINYTFPDVCTTVDVYNIKYANKKITIEEASCNWNGFNRLKSILID